MTDPLGKRQEPVFKTRDCEYCGKEIREWGCPKCGGKATTVFYVESDDDGNRLRVRVCSNCKTKWATEETPISISAFHFRAASKRKRDLAKRQLSRDCPICGMRYIMGHYYPHTKSARHTKALAKRREEAGSLERRRFRQMIWHRLQRARDRTARHANV